MVVYPGQIPGNATIGGSATVGGTLDVEGQLTGFSGLGLSGGALIEGLATLNGGTNTSGAAAILTPDFTSATPAQLSDTSRDYMVYFAIGTAGTISLAIGPTDTPANTLINNKTATAGEPIAFRLPAGWFVEVTLTTATLAVQLAVGC